ncbi:MAG TPA: SUMF1/EgtB/PvdO family nonheme iron enzyme [Verrucomicrobiae bacterium]|nr:SUMF1/EgtB/PvdO family nonheme iron enzyme [Verrucomicrobiae bacterium]
MTERIPHLARRVIGRAAGAWRLGCAALLLLAFGGCDRQQPASEPEAVKLLPTASGMAMVSIPAGQFMMGTDDGPIDAKPAHQVKVDSFLMDQCEMTQEIYEKITGKNPSRRRNPRNPVEQVTWSAAARFCNARSVLEGLTPCYDTNTWACNFSASGYRLPTEAEWEYACRAGSGTGYYFGENAQELRSYGWFDGNSQATPHPVGQRKPNAWGLYDMAGNVWEWCNDFYGAKYFRSSPADNPHGPPEGEKRVLRGGAWSSTAENCTSWVRNCDEAGVSDICLTMDSNGFRCVRRK